MLKSFSTTVHTPRKNPGRNSPSRMSASSGGGATLNPCGCGYISCSAGANSTSALLGPPATAAPRSSPRSSAMVGTTFIGSIGHVEVLAAPAHRRDVPDEQLEVALARGPAQG